MRGVRVRNCYIHDHGSATLTGAIIDFAVTFAAAQDVEVSWCLIKNVARGGISIAHNEIQTIQNVVFKYNIIDNWAAHGGSIISNTSDLTISNCIFWNHAPEELYNCNPQITYSCVQGGYEGLGNIDVNPLVYEMLCGRICLCQESAGHTNTLFTMVKLLQGLK